MERGELVDDALICQVMGARLGEPDAAGGFILDGFPRTAPQAGALDALLGRLGVGLTGALLLDVGDEQVVERLSGRRTCPACGRVYHTAFNPPRRDGRCDHDGTPLAQRDDDRPAIIGNRPSRLPPPASSRPTAVSATTRCQRRARGAQGAAQARQALGAGARHPQARHGSLREGDRDPVTVCAGSCKAGAQAVAPRPTTGMTLGSGRGLFVRDSRSVGRPPRGDEIVPGAPPLSRLYERGRVVKCGGGGVRDARRP
jgi:hypothetical protein